MHKWIRIAHVTMSATSKKGARDLCRMPPKKGGGQWQPKGTDDTRWVAAAAARIGAVRRDLSDSAAELAAQHLPPPPPPPAGSAAAASASSRAEPSAARDDSGVPVRGQPQTPAEELAALRFARASPTTFALQRHAVMICGRPVVALNTSQTYLLCCNGMYDVELSATS